MNDLKKMIELTVSLHALIVCDMDESEEADNIRDQMDIYWHLSEEDQEWLNDFSASLYDITNVIYESMPMRKCSEEIDRLRKEIERLKSE